MKKNVWLISGLIVALLAAGGVTWYFISHDQGQTSNTNAKKTEVILGTEDNQFTLKATKQDSLGTLPDTSFILSSTRPVETKTVEAALSVSPEIAYKIESSDNNTFTISPAQPLEANEVYAFSLTAASTATSNKREYQWAYQIKDSFKITGTLPRDKTTSIPTNTGIEVTFSTENYDSPEQFFSISPRTDGTFERHRKTLVYVPKSLTENTVYTVTIKKGLGVKDSTDVLADDYSFQFATVNAASNQGYMSFDSKFFEFSPEENPVMTMYEYNTNLSKVTVDVWSFPNFNTFNDAVKTREVSVPLWAYDFGNSYTYPTNSLTKEVSFSADLKSGDYFRYIEFPDNLRAGQYLVEISYANGKTQAFVQVSDLVSTLQISKTNSLIWVHRLTTKLPEKNATITYSKDDSKVASTNDQGVGAWETPEELHALTTSQYSDQSDRTYHFIISSGNDKLLVPAQMNNYEYMAYPSGPAATNPDYWSYLYTNRSLYLPTDSIKFWGIAKSRAGQKLPEVTVNLISFTYSNETSQENVVGTSKAAISDYGTFEGTIKYQNLNPGSYQVRVMAGDQQISVGYVDIQTYTKPSYGIDISMPKKAIFSGEKAVFDVTAKFFDGTPVSNLQLQYTGQFGEGTVTTDSTGAARLSFDRPYEQYQTQQYSSSYITVHPVQAELTYIESTANIYQFNSRSAITLEQNEPGKVNGKVNAVDLTNLNAPGNDIKWDYLGKPVANAKVHLNVYEQYYDKIENGTTYDFINKKTITSYRYEYREKSIAETDVNSGSDGSFSYNYTTQPKKWYKVIASTTDSNGHAVESSSYGSSYGIPGSSYDYYYLSTNHENETVQNVYAPGENVVATLKKDDVTVTSTGNNDFLFFKEHNGISDINAGANPEISFPFKEAYAPNVYVYAIYFNGRSYRQATANIVMKTDPKKLTVDVTQDKAAYAPGDKVKLDLSVTDPDSKPVKAAVNVSLIDQALAAIQWETSLNTLGALYQQLPSSVTMSYSSHKENVSPMAERGGCFTGETMISLADGTEKRIDSVEIGDQIRTFENENNLNMTTAKVTNTIKHTVAEYLSINERLNVTPVHVILINGKWEIAGNAHVGDFLTDANGQSVLITSIVRHHRYTDVYNLTTDPAHTFIASGLYVHNEKGGGRQNFQDVAYFGSTETGRDGKASISFKLPDNVTSWQTTVQAITEDLSAGGTRTAVVATLPFFADVAVASEYLTTDQPIIKLRGFGQALSATDTVSFEVTYPDINKTEKYTAKAFVAADVALPKFEAGQHKITVKASAAGHTDTLTKTITITPTHLTKQDIKYLAVTNDLKLTADGASRTSLLFTNKERGQYLNDLSQLKYAYGDRIDQKLARVISQKLLNTYFGQKGMGEEISFTDYQTPEGGLSILPYSSAELLLTAKTMAVAPDIFDKNDARGYFETTLKNKNSNLDEIVYALYGEANMGEPVLNDILSLMDNNDVPDNLKLYLANGLANLGAGEYARSLLADVVKKYGEVQEPYFRLKLGETNDDYTENTYQAAIIAANVSAPEATKMFAYAVDHPAVDQLNSLEQIGYLQKVLPLLSGEAVKFTYTLDGQAKNVSLSGDETESLSVTPSQLSGLTFSNITGNVGVIQTNDVPLDIKAEKTDSSLSIKRTFYVDGKATSTLKENDLVKIVLEPSINSKAIDNEYQIVDYLPAGLKVLSYAYNRLINYDPNLAYPYEINGQAIKFWSGKPAREMHYYATVISKGSFTAEPTLIRGFKVPTSKAFGQSESVTIK